MKNIQIISRNKYKNLKEYRLIEEGIYRCLRAGVDVERGDYVIALSFTLEVERGELDNRQYPMRDIQDKFYAVISEVISGEDLSNIIEYEFSTGGELADIQALKSIVGKEVYNEDFEEEGIIYTKLVIK
ncbi:hypothetical protein AwErysi_00470 [Erysipelotrichaceae bacterium]|nr:hypothetical protein AwErysi_00470 [Erysipelotrichaceae bacterium]